MTAPKNMSEVVDGERYRTALARLIASDDEAVFLFRANNSDYFVQRHGERDELEVLPSDEAEKLYAALPEKHQGVVNAFPKSRGGVGFDTETVFDDEEERERILREYGQPRGEPRETERSAQG